MCNILWLIKIEHLFSNFTFKNIKVKLRNTNPHSDSIIENVTLKLIPETLILICIV